MKIRVNTLTGRGVMINLKKDNVIVADLKDYVFEETGIPVQNQKLTINGKDNGDFYFIQEGDQIHMRVVEDKTKKKSDLFELLDELREFDFGCQGIR